MHGHMNVKLSWDNYFLGFLNKKQDCYLLNSELLSMLKETYILLKKQQRLRIQHFIFQLMHTTLKNVELLKHFKIRKTAPTCFVLQGNHHQEATVST